MKPSFKTLSLLSIGMALFLGVILPGLLVVIVDPFRIYHESLFPKVGYSDIQRYQHAGLIHTYLRGNTGYDSVVIGPSTSANYYPEDVSRILGWGKVLNLSINGSAPVEDRQVAEYALRTGHVRHLMWDMQTQFLAEEPDMLNDSGKKQPFPAYLYNRNPFDDYPYVFNLDNLMTSLRFLRGNFTGFTRDIGRTGSWYEHARQDNKFAAFRSLDYVRNSLEFPLPTNENLAYSPRTFSPDEFQYPSIDRNILDTVMPYCGKDVDITLFFTPIARVKYAFVVPDQRSMHRYAFMRRYILDHIRDCPNIRLFAFDTVDWLAGNRENYMDPYHYDIAINHYILQSFAHNENRLTPENIGVYEQQFGQKAEEYLHEILRQLGNPVPGHP